MTALAAALIPAKEESAEALADIYGWAAILFNCNCHLFDYAVASVMHAAGLRYADAIDVVATADALGESVVRQGSKSLRDAVVTSLRRDELNAAVRRIDTVRDF